MIKATKKETKNIAEKFNMHYLEVIKHINTKNFDELNGTNNSRKQLIDFRTQERKQKEYGNNNLVKYYNSRIELLTKYLLITADL